MGGKLASSRLNQRVLWGANFLKYFVQMFETLINRKRVHLPPVLIAAGLNEILQVMTGNLNGQRISNDSSSALLIFHPGRMGQGDPYWMPIDQEFDVNGIGMASGDGNNESLVKAMKLLAGPAIGYVKVIVHFS
jgi:hypothetical protein